MSVHELAKTLAGVGTPLGEEEWIRNYARLSELVGELRQENAELQMRVARLEYELLWHADEHLRTDWRLRMAYKDGSRSGGRRPGSLNRKTKARVEATRRAAEAMANQDGSGVFAGDAHALLM